MGNKKKFDKIERNEAYYEVYGEETEEKQQEKRVKKEKKNKKILGVLDAENVPEKKEPSAKFTYKREKRKIVYSEGEKAEVEAPPKPVLVLTLVVMCLVLLMSFAVTSDVYMSLGAAASSAIKVAMLVAAYIVPSVVYIVAVPKARHPHNVRRFSASTLMFCGACLGFMLCFSALQKYMIAYTFSYSEPALQAGGNVWLTILTGALIPAVCEELFVRGILQHEISRYAGGFCGVTVGALVFAMLHYELQYFMVYFFAGLVLGAVTHVTRSVFPAMAVHFLNNLLVLILPDRLSFLATERIGGTLLIIVLAVICFGFLILTLHLAEKISEKRMKYYLSREGKEGEDKLDDEPCAFFMLSPDKKTGTRLTKVLTAPMMLACIVIFLIIVFIKL